MRFLPSEPPPREGVDLGLKAWLTRLVININASLSSAEYYNQMVLTTVDVTLSNNQVAICKNAGPINVTLPTTPYIGTSVYVKRRGSGLVTIVGTIDGAANLNLVGNGHAHLVYDGVDWSTI